MHRAGVDEAPAVAEAVRIVALDMESVAGVVLEDGHGVVLAFEEKFDGLGAKLCPVEAVEEDRPAAALGVAHFTSEDGFACGFATAVALEIFIANHRDQSRPQSFRCA